MDLRTLVNWKKELWDLSREIIDLFIPGFSSKYYYVVQASCMDGRNCKVPLHCDKWNLTPQYHLVCGDFQGAFLECFSPDGTFSTLFSSRYSLLKFDGRLKHQLRTNQLEGMRYTLVYYVSYVENQELVEELFYPPKYLGWNAFFFSRIKQSFFVLFFRLFFFGLNEIN